MDATAGSVFGARARWVISESGCLLQENNNQKDSSTWGLYNVRPLID